MQVYSFHQLVAFFPAIVSVVKSAFLYSSLFLSFWLLLHLHTLTALATQNKAEHSKRHTIKRKRIKKGTKFSPWVHGTPQTHPEILLYQNLAHATV